MKIHGFILECAQWVQVFHIFIGAEEVVVCIIMVVTNDPGVLALLLVKYVLKGYEFSIINEHHVFDLHDRIGQRHLSPIPVILQELLKVNRLIIFNAADYAIYPLSHSCGLTQFRGSTALTQICWLAFESAECIRHLS